MVGCAWGRRELCFDAQDQWGTMGAVSALWEPLTTTAVAGFSLAVGGYVFQVRSEGTRARNGPWAACSARGAFGWRG